MSQPGSPTSSNTPGGEGLGKKKKKKAYTCIHKNFSLNVTGSSVLSGDPSLVFQVYFSSLNLATSLTTTLSQM